MMQTPGFSTGGENFTTCDNCTELTEEERTVMALTVATLAVIFVFGTAGNVLTCAVILRYSKMRTAFNILVLHLATTDLLLAAVATPTYAARLVYELRSASDVALPAEDATMLTTACKLSAFVHYVCTCQSLLIMLEMGIIRVLAVRKSSKSHRFRIAKAVPYTLVVVDYIISVIFAVLNYAKGTFTFCLDESQRSSIGVRLMNILILFGILAVISVSYVWIFASTKRHRVGVLNEQPNVVQAARRGVNRFDIATAKTLLLVLGAYSIGYLPYVSFIIRWMAGAVTDEPRIMTIYPALSSVYSVANPIIYSISSVVFRRHLLKLLRLEKFVAKKTTPVVIQHPGSNPVATRRR